MSENGHATRPRWMDIYDHLRTLDFNEDASYEQLSAIAGVDDIRDHRGYVGRARQELERTDHKTIVCIPNYGYRIADPSEHEHLGLAHRARAGRQLGREYSRRASTAFELLPPADAERLRLEANNAARVMRVFERLSTRPQLPAGPRPEGEAA